MRVKEKNKWALLHLHAPNHIFSFLCSLVLKFISVNVFWQLSRNWNNSSLLPELMLDLGSLGSLLLTKPTCIRCSANWPFMLCSIWVTTRQIASKNAACTLTVRTELECNHVLLLAYLECIGRQEVVPAVLPLIPGTTLFRFLPPLINQWMIN